MRWGSRQKPFCLRQKFLKVIVISLMSTMPGFGAQESDKAVRCQDNVDQIKPYDPHK